MIIRELTLENFMCYYGTDNTFEFHEGLNIVLGHNGDGKSTIFNAIKWMFDTNYKRSSELYSLKKYSEIHETDEFNVLVRLVVEQYGDEYTLEKWFSVTKNPNGAVLSPVEEKVFVKNLITGENGIEHISISDLSLRVFPEEFRNFSMFETETDTLNIVKGKALAELVKNFSEAKFYEELENIITEFNARADRQYRKESKADQKTTEELERLDRVIDRKTAEKTNIDEQIESDINGKNVYTDRLNELIDKLGLAERYNEIESRIADLEKENESLGRGINDRFTDLLFDDMYFLVGFESIISDYSKKVDELRLKRNEEIDKANAEYAVEKLRLENNVTPLPPGSPNVNILNEFLDDNTCKICGRKLDEGSRAYINQSIKLYNEQQQSSQNLKRPQVFNRTFIEELGLLDSSFRIQEQRNKFSKERIIGEIDFLKNKNKDNTNKIQENRRELNILEVQKNEIINSAALSPEVLANVFKEHNEISTKLSDLNVKIGRNEMKSLQLKNEIDEQVLLRNKMLGQMQPTTFKHNTCLMLQQLKQFATIIKDNEYEKFLNILSERATKYLKEINTGEIVGFIKLVKNRDEIVTERYNNDDGNVRPSLMDTGALDITIPLSILLAIADLAAEIREGDEKEGYPMIFDAPTGRLSPDRERNFFEVLKNSKKQRIVVTLRFLETDEKGIPYVEKDKFSRISFDKAFFIKRERPMDENDPATINTNIYDVNL